MVFAAGLCVFAKQTEDFRTYKGKKKQKLFFLGFSFSCSWLFSLIFYISCQKKYGFYFIFSWVVLELVAVFLPNKLRGFFGSKKEIGSLVSLLLGFLCLFFSF